MNHLHRKKAFTLIELVVVIAILALLLAIAVPKYATSKKTAAITAHNSNVRMIKTAALTYTIDHPDATTLTVDTLVTENYLEKKPIVPKEVDKGKEYSIKISENDITVSPAEIDTTGK